MAVVALPPTPADLSAFPSTGRASEPLSSSRSPRHPCMLLACPPGRRPASRFFCPSSPISIVGVGALYVSRNSSREQLRLVIIQQDACPRPKLTSSPTLMLCPPQLGRRTLSPTLTETGWTAPSLLGAPGPVAMTLASGRGELVADEGRKMPVAVFCSGLKRWRRTRSSRGLTLVMERIVERDCGCDRRSLGSRKVR